MIEKFKAEGGDLADDEIAEAVGEREQLAGKIQAKYGKSKEQEVDEWIAKQ